jgi:hypothetical protein
MTKTNIFLILVLVNITSAFAQWTKIPTIPSVRIHTLTVIGDTLFAASDTILYTSTDEGINWSPVPLQYDTFSLVKVMDDKLYVGTYGGNILLSTDRGATWQQTGNVFEPVSQLENHDGTLYAATLGGGVYSYAQGNWIPVNGSLPFYSYNVDAMYSSGSTLLIGCGSNGTFYRFMPASSSWNEEYYDEALRPGLQIQQIIGQSDTILAVNGNRIYRSDDNGGTWDADNIGFHNGTSRKIHEGTSNYYMVTNSPTTGGIWVQQRNKHAPAGTTWAEQEEFIPGNLAYDLLEFGEQLFLAKANGLYRKSVSTGVNDIHILENEITVFPNPSHQSTFTITNPQQVSRIVIYNVSGEEVYLSTPCKGKCTIQLDLEQGIYLMMLDLENGQRVVKKISRD